MTYVAGTLYGRSAGALTMPDFTIALAILGVIALLFVGNFFQLPNEAGAQVSGRDWAHNQKASGAGILVMP